MNLSISVLIATYCRARMLERCLAHLAGQEFAQGDEIIVADNGSSDATAAVVRAASAGTPIPVRYVYEREPGKSRALTSGLKAASGTLVALTDDDVIVGRDWIATIRQVWRERSPGLAGGRVLPIWERPAPAWLRIDAPSGYGPLAAPLAVLDYGPVAAPLAGRTARGANMVLSRHALEAVGGFPANLGKLRGTLLSGEDHEVCDRVQAAGFAAIYEPRLAVRHHVPAERLTLGYHVRWFFWSGITNAALDERPSSRSGRPIRLRHWTARIGRNGWRALSGLPRARPGVVAESLVEIAFSLGYLAYSRGLVKVPVARSGRVAGRSEVA